MHTRRVAVSDLSSVLLSPWVDTSHRPYVNGDVAYVPVLNGYDYECVLAKKSRYQGRGYQKIGDVIAFHGSRPSDAEVTNVVLHERPRGVIWIKKNLGTMRIPDIDILFGMAGEVIHQESGILYQLDVSQVMFSQGNRQEKKRISTLIRPGERVADMFAGIGYFTLSIARAGGFVHAIEINPISYYYLVKNISLNSLTHQVNPEKGNCHDKLTGIYNRIVMGHFDSWIFLDKALCHVMEGSVLHIHGIEDKETNILQILKKHTFSYDISSHFVKSTSPRKRHMVWDIRII